MNMSGG
jgi:ATP-binding cassette subfamily B (MDR/TAP) protein 1